MLKIGGLHLDAYTKYMYVHPKRNESRFQQNVLLDRLNVSVCLNYLSSLQQLIARISYLIWHGFSLYPNNAYLFAKFKTHKFEEIKEQFAFERVKILYNHFCSDKSINRLELKEVGKKLEKIREQWVTDSSSEQGDSLSSSQTSSFSSPSIQSSCALELVPMEEMQLIGSSKPEDFPRFVEKGSFLYTHFLNQFEKKDQEFLLDLSTNLNDCRKKLHQEKNVILLTKLKKQFHAIVFSYVFDWIKRSGMDLHFKESASNDTAHFRHTGEGFIGESSKWVEHMSVLYSKRLKKMRADELELEVQKMRCCPLIRLLIAAFSQDKEVQTFSDPIMSEWCKIDVTGETKVEDDLKTLMMQAKFKGSKGESARLVLTKGATCKEADIDALVRTRVFYIMYTLGQGIAKNVSQRIETPLWQTEMQKYFFVDVVGRTLKFHDDFDSFCLALDYRFVETNEEGCIVAKSSSILSVKTHQFLPSKKRGGQVSLTEWNELHVSPWIEEEAGNYLREQVEQSVQTKIQAGRDNLKRKLLRRLSSIGKNND